MKFEKKAITIDDQIKLLLSRGLKISDPDFAKFHLSNVSFYRFAAYTLHFQINKDHTFATGTTFEQVYRLYCFDRELRLITFEAIEKIENAVKGQLINQMSVTHGPHWYTNRNHFNKIYNHDGLITWIKELQSNDEEIYIKHYSRKYSEPPMPPAWMIIEAMSFGGISRMIEGLAAPEQRQSICTHFGTVHLFLTSWLRSLNWIRNASAHHARLWDRKITNEPKFPSRESAKFLINENFPKDKLYASLCIAQKLLQKTETPEIFKPKLKKILAYYSEIPKDKMGFPSEWEKEQLWI